MVERFFLRLAELACQEQAVFFHHQITGFETVNHQDLLHAFVAQLDAVRFKHTGLCLHVGPMLGASQQHDAGGNQHAAFNLARNACGAQHFGFE